MITIHRGLFGSYQDALSDVAESRVFPRAFRPDTTGPRTQSSLHWHDQDVHIYMIDGNAFLEDESGESWRIDAGDKAIIPAKTIHREAGVSDDALVLLAWANVIPGQGDIVEHPTDQLVR